LFLPRCVGNVFGKAAPFLWGRFQEKTLSFWGVTSPRNIEYVCWFFLRGRSLKKRSLSPSENPLIGGFFSAPFKPPRGVKHKKGRVFKEKIKVYGHRRERVNPFRDIGLKTL